MQGRFSHLTPKAIQAIQANVDEEWEILMAKTSAPKISRKQLPKREN